MTPDQTRRAPSGPLLSTAVLVLVVLLGVPRVWASLVSGGAGLDLLFYPVLLGGFGYLAVSRR